MYDSEGRPKVDINKFLIVPVPLNTWNRAVLQKTTGSSWILANSRSKMQGFRGRILQLIDAVAEDLSNPQAANHSLCPSDNY